MEKLPPSDDELMLAVSDGQAAFSELMRRHQGWVRRVVGSAVLDRDQAEDLAQEVFLRVHQHARGYTARGSFTAWLRRIALNLSRNALARKQLIRSIPLQDLEEVEDLEDEAMADGRMDPMALCMVNRTRQDVREAIEALPEAQRLTLVLRFFGNLSVQDIAWAMKCPEGTVKSRLFHALKRVREVVTEGQREQERST